MRLHRSALLAGLAAFVVTLLASSAGQAQTIVRCRTTGGSLVDCTTPLLNTYINWGSPSAIGGTAPAAVTGTTITATTQFSGPATGLTGIPAAQITGSLSGVTINCSSNTCSQIANAALVNSSLTVTAGTGLSGGGAVSLGGSVSLSLPNVGPGAGAIAYPVSVTLDAQGRVTAATAGSAPAPATRLINTGTGLSGGGDLSADRTLAIDATVATLTGTQILTNKTLNCANNTCTVRLGSDVTGTLAEANGGFASDISGIGTGLIARTAANTYSARTITGPAAGITVSNGGGGSGNPTLALANDLAAVEGLSTNGCAARTATDTWTTRTVTAGTGISVTNGDCTAGNPTIAVDTGTVVTLTGTQTLTNKTLTSPVLGSTITGSYSLGGTPSLGTNLTGGLNKITGLAAGTTTGDSVRWEQAGVAGPTFYLNTSQSFVANGYVGLGGDGSSTVNVNIVPWVAPVACTLRNLRVFGLANTSGSVVFTIYKSSSAVSPTYASTTLTCTLTNTFACSDTSHSVSLSAGDLVVGFTGSSWSSNGASVTTQCVPN